MTWGDPLIDDDGPGSREPWEPSANRRLRALLATALERVGIPAAELARRVGVNRQHVSATLNGSTKTVSPDVAEAYLRALGLRLDFVVRDEDEPVAPTDLSEAQRLLLRRFLAVLPKLSDHEAQIVQQMLRGLHPEQRGELPDQR